MCVCGRGCVCVTSITIHAPVNLLANPMYLIFSPKTSGGVTSGSWLCMTDIILQWSMISDGSPKGAQSVSHDCRSTLL